MLPGTAIAIFRVLERGADGAQLNLGLEHVGTRALFRLQQLLGGSHSVLGQCHQLLGELDGLLRAQYLIEADAQVVEDTPLLGVELPFADLYILPLRFASQAELPSRDEFLTEEDAVGLTLSALVSVRA